MTRYLMTEDLVTGNEEVDLQHQSLFGLANEILEPESGHEAATSFFALLSYLANYVQEHFAAEESAMAASAYLNLEQHRRFHQEFRDRIAAILERSLHEPKLDELRRELSRAVMVLLLRHIRIEDKAMAAHLKARHVDVAPMSLPPQMHTSATLRVRSTE
jgi:hemerythrin